MTRHLREDEAADRTLYDSLRSKLRALYQRDQFEIHDKVLEFHNSLKRKYPNPREYRLFHLISGSTLRESYGAVDLPQPDSIEDFINLEYGKAFPNGEQKNRTPEVPK